ncbi:MAG: sodium-dependent transporter [Bacteroidaceae bacterium]|nr:sodium-dependent transporter [Bacteroidaceae bacterium]MBO4592645.1 sodium-dependent transporter [Bacteroidaceae bacterium]MBR4782356.1 sodium-dependent transporter [Bacteroidaceae bacterium]
MTQKRASFGSKFGILMAAAGSAVGLGNIWRFPIETGQHGGAAFLLVYIAAIALLGIPLMVAEFFVGRNARTNAAHAYRKLSSHPVWRNIGFIGAISGSLILCYYVVVSGWVLKYFVVSLDGTLGGLFRPGDASGYESLFADFVSSSWSPLLYMALFVLMCHFTITAGVRQGIEKLSKIFMPALFVILIVLVGFSLFAPGAQEGLSFLFHPDFSKLTTRTVLSAIAQAFYSLSLCMGCLCTYASYFGKNVNLVNSALSISVIDTLVAIMAGLIVFPAVFSSGINLESGPSLAFIALPGAFHQAFSAVPWLSWLVSTLFYALLVLAALTSAISLYEVPTAYIHETWHIRRSRAALLVTVVCLLLGAVCSLSMGILGDIHLFGKTIFDFLDYFCTTIMMPLCGILIAIFVGWIVKRDVFLKEVNTFGPNPTDAAQAGRRWSTVILFLLRWVAPVLLLLAFLGVLGII